MRGQREAAELATLKRCWRRWTAVVNLFARRRGARHRVDPRAYDTLHKELLEACRAQEGTADEAGRAFYESLEDLAQPWLSVRVLEAARFVGSLDDA